MTTMDQRYGDGSNHPCCPVCGYCLKCGDCDCQKNTRVSCSGSQEPSAAPQLRRDGTSRLYYDPEKKAIVREDTGEVVMKETIGEVEWF